MEDDTRINQAVDEVAACINMARNIASQILRTVSSIKANADAAADKGLGAVYVGALYESTLTWIAEDMQTLQGMADRAKEAVKYLGVKE